MVATSINNVLLVKIEGPVWYTIYHHLPVVKGVCYTPLFSSTNQWEEDIYGVATSPFYIRPMKRYKAYVFGLNFSGYTPKSYGLKYGNY